MIAFLNQDIASDFQILQKARPKSKSEKMKTPFEVFGQLVDKEMKIFKIYIPNTQAPPKLTYGGKLLKIVKFAFKKLTENESGYSINGV